MPTIKSLSLVISCATVVLISHLSVANTTQMHTTLARIRTLLSQVNPLINLAQHQQDPNVRVQFQFDALRQDIAAIQAGIGQAINRVSIEPRVVQPLRGDYLPVSKSVSGKTQSSPNKATHS